jgi:hypothetical protein
MDIASVLPACEFNLTDMGETVRLTGSIVSDNLFAVLRAPVQFGRSLQGGEHRHGADSVVILSTALDHTIPQRSAGHRPHRHVE